MIATMAITMNAPTRMPPPICLRDSRNGKLVLGVIPGSTAARYNIVNSNRWLPTGVDVLFTCFMAMERENYMTAGECVGPT